MGLGGELERLPEAVHVTLRIKMSADVITVVKELG
jgi:hypothetical protein